MPESRPCVAYMLSGVKHSTNLCQAPAYLREACVTEQI